MSSRQGRIEICGGIAAGKTTLARTLAALADVPVVLERFEQNPFWKLFYERPAVFVHEKNISFLAQHTGHIKEVGEYAPLVCDYAVFQDLAYASLLKDPVHTDVMGAVYRHLYGQLPRPALIVHLTCDPQVQLARIASRGRPQEASIGIDYLAALNEAIVKQLKDASVGVIVREVCSHEMNFAVDRALATRLGGELLDCLATTP
jgi:deoxyadenosine/deoxycytidine kinase